MKKSYWIGGLIAILLLVQFVTILGLRNDVTSVRQELTNLGTEVSRVNSSVNSVEHEVRQIKEVSEQSRIVIDQSTNIEVLDLSQNIGEAYIEVLTSNVHKDSIATLSYKKQNHSKKGTFIQSVSKNEWHTEEEYLEEDVTVGEIVQVVLKNDGNGKYSSVIPVELSAYYEMFISIEHSGVIYQEELESLYVHDETSIGTHFMLEHSYYDVKTEQANISFMVDVNRVKDNSVDEAVLKVYHENELIDSVDYTEVIDRIITLDVYWYEIMDEDEGFFRYALDFEVGQTYDFIFEIRDGYGRITQNTSTLKMVE